MILRSIVFLSILSTSTLYAQENWRSQHVKWHLGFNYNNSKLIDVKENSFTHEIEKVSGVLSVDVSLSENDVFDSSDLYLQPYFEVSIPGEAKYNTNLKLSSYAGGINLKKHLSFGNFKSNIYLFTGGKIEYLVWNIKSGKNGSGYDNTKIDYIFSAGAGFLFLNQLEIFAAYSRGLSKSYYSSVVNDNLYAMSSFTIGLRIGLSKNWWFINKY